MKNLLHRIKGSFGAISERFHVAASDTSAVLKCNKAEGFVDTAVKILISVVIGAIIPTIQRNYPADTYTTYSGNVQF